MGNIRTCVVCRPTHQHTIYLWNPPYYTYQNQPTTLHPRVHSIVLFSVPTLTVRACVRATTKTQHTNTNTHTHTHTHTGECREGGRINNNEELVDSTDYGLIYYGHIGGGVSINEYESIQLYHHTVVPIQSYQYSCTYVPTILGMWNVECGTDGSIRVLGI